MPFTVYGGKLSQEIPDVSLGKQIYITLLENQHLSEVLIDGSSGEAISYKSLLVDTCALATSLQSLGIERNSVIGICSENSFLYFHPAIAAFYLGAIVAPLSPNYTSHELLHGANTTKPQIIFCTKATLEKVNFLKDSVNYIQKIIVLDTREEESGHALFQDLIRTGSAFNERLFEPVEANPKEQVALLMCSSGTTGLPKAAMITHRNVQIGLSQHRDSQFISQEPHGATTIGVLPFYHMYGFIIGLAATSLGHKLVVLKKFDRQLYLETVQNYKCKTIFVAPPIMNFLAKHPMVDEYDISSVEDIISSAAPLSTEIEDSVKQRLNIPSVRQVYGMTETTFAALGTPLTGEHKPGSSGTVMPGIRAKIRDLESHETLDQGKLGELCFKGDLIMKGYVSNEEATTNTIDRDGYLCTGDIAYYDHDKYFYIVDRVKELIKYNGFQVSPAELEELLLTHPSIQDAAVIGRPDTEAGELPLAFVVRKPDCLLTQTEVQDFVAKNVSHLKRLRGGVIFVNAIPKNPSGKILRRQLRNLL